MKDAIDILGPCPQREELVGTLLQEVVSKADLSSYVRRAADSTSFPISLVSLMGRRSQLFAASTGLPAELAHIGATDRSVSLCQRVVRDEVPTDWEDASLDESAPQGMVKAYGVRSYLGVPLRVQGLVVGALCIVDSVPRKVSDEQRQRLVQLAEELSRKLDLEVTALLQTRQGDAHAEAVEPIFAELRNLLAPLGCGVGQAALSNAELQSALRLLKVKDAAARERAQSVLNETLEASDDLAEILGELQQTSQRLSRSILAMESIFDRVERLKPIEHCILQGSLIAEHLTKLVGGVRLENSAPHSVQVVARTVVPLVALLLGSGSRRLMERKVSGGLTVRTRESPDGFLIQIHAPLWTHSDAVRCVRHASALIQNEAALSLTAVAGTIELRSGLGAPAQMDVELTNEEARAFRQNGLLRAESGTTRVSTGRSYSHTRTCRSS